jgi:ABC-2 type transport system ATP-binding protein
MGEPMSEPAIFAEGLVKEFKTVDGTLTAVNQLSLEVGRGETFGLIGPDGAGKTTATRVILGLLTRTAGECEILGFDPMRDMYQVRERVGYIAQQFSLPVDLTVKENLRLFADLQGVGQEGQKRRVDELLAFADLRESAGRLAGKLSGGMKKKLALACSLLHEPQVVCLDEPTLGVDPVSRREFWKLLGDLQVEKGLTIFVTTPYMDEAERCTRVGLMYEGKLIASGTPQDIKAMLPGHLLELTPSDFAAAERRIGELDGVLEVQTYGEKLHVFVDDVVLRGPQIEATLETSGIRRTGMREVEVSMEEAFISLIRRRARDRRGELPGVQTDD